VTALALSRDGLENTFGQLRICGQREKECVLYWVAPASSPGTVSRIVHPDHTAHLGGYDVDSAWVTRFFLELRERKETAVAQVHTHPRFASHSDTDDRFALVPATGFVSLVIPNFADGPVSLADSHLVVMQADGNWMEMPPSAVINIE